jgi:pimeloyl-ACP methyl ester carboxylesterase
LPDTVLLNGVRLYVDVRGDDPPTVVLVHGSWDSHRTWERVAARIRGSTVLYDRRGHSRSRQPLGQGTIDEDVGDLAAVIDWVDRGPVAVVGHSYGATVALLLACRRPAVVHHVVAHEPPLFAVLRGRPEHAERLDEVMRSMQEAAALIEGGAAEEAAEMFVERVGFGPGAWQQVFSEEDRAEMVSNADTWLDQYRDPQRLAVSLELLASLTVPVLITRGTQSPELYGPALDLVLAGAAQLSSTTIAGCGHAVAHTHPAELAAAVHDFVSRSPASTGRTGSAP